MCSTALAFDVTTDASHNLCQDASAPLRPWPMNTNSDCGGATFPATEARIHPGAYRKCHADFWEPASETRNTRLVWDGRLMTRSSLGHTLILQSHPGDELSCAGLLQHCRNPVVVFATDGMSETESSCPTNGRRETLRYLRRQEATTALMLAGVRQVEFLSEYRNNLRELRLYRAVPNLFNTM